MDLHANAVLSVRQRQRFCGLVAAGVTITAAAVVVGCSRQTASKWVNRRRRGESLCDRSSRPRRSSHGELGARVVASPMQPRTGTTCTRPGCWRDALACDSDLVAQDYASAFRMGSTRLLDLVSFAPDASVLKEGGRLASPLGAAGEGPGRTNLIASGTTANLERLAELLGSGLSARPRPRRPMDSNRQAKRCSRTRRSSRPRRWLRLRERCRHRRARARRGLRIAVRPATGAAPTASRPTLCGACATDPARSRRNQPNYPRAPPDSRAGRIRTPHRRPRTALPLSRPPRGLPRNRAQRYGKLVLGHALEHPGQSRHPPG